MINTLLETELQGLYGDHLAKISQINKWYKIYDGDQEWDTVGDLDYRPTKKITNLIKGLIDTRARFMFGREPFFDVRPVKKDEDETTTYKDEAQAKEDLLKDILVENKFHSKALKAYKDCAIGGRVAIKLWAHKDEGVKIIFTPAQEFFVKHDIDDVDKFEKVIFIYNLNDEKQKEDQRIKKQVWELINGRCILNETTHDGSGKIVSTEYENYDTSLDFIPVIVIKNGGLTGETEGESNVKQLWDNQDAYNRLTSDDLDALKFQMFGQDVITDAAEKSLENIKIAPGAMIDLQTDQAQMAQGKQASVERLESKFSYSEKFKDTIDRIKNDMYDTLSVPNVGLEQLKGLMQSGKSMRALYWQLMAACDEDWIEWNTALMQMADYIFRMIDVYNIHGNREIARGETTLEIIRTYPITDDESEQKRIDMEEVIAEVRSRESYIDKWSNVESVQIEIEQILKEKQLFQEDIFTQSLKGDLGEGGEGE